MLLQTDEEEEYSQKKNPLMQQKIMPLTYSLCYLRNDHLILLWVKVWDFNLVVKFKIPPQECKILDTMLGKEQYKTAELSNKYLKNLIHCQWNHCQHKEYKRM